MEDRRKFPRRKACYPLQLKAVTVTGDHLIRNSFCNNISIVGIAITSFDFYPVNDMVHLRIFSDAWTSLIDTMGKVIWVEQLAFQKKFRIGIEFIDTNENLIMKIKSEL